VSKYATIIKAVEYNDYSRKDIGNRGETLASDWLRRQGYSIVARNLARKTGELDIVAKKQGVLIAVEVKTVLVNELPREGEVKDTYDPSANLHEAKLRRVGRTLEWYAASIDFEGDIQVDAVLVWLRKRDLASLVVHLPQIL
jgi:putative endonuclease